MRKSIEVYSVRSADDPSTSLRLRRDPVLRFTNPVGTLKDGALFLWTGQGGRPAAAAQVFWKPERGWAHELTSLSVTPLVAAGGGDADWRPPAGVRFEPIPDAPPPAQRAEHRLRQMRTLADGFTAKHHYQAKVWNELRILPKPLARYGDERGEVRDGALFGFAYGTDPEVLLMLEARQAPRGDRWEYALAPMTSFAVRVAWKAQPVWERPVSWTVMRNPDQAFHVRSVSDAAVASPARDAGAAP